MNNCKFSELVDLSRMLHLALEFFPKCDVSSRRTECFLELCFWADFQGGMFLNSCSSIHGYLSGGMEKVIVYMGHH